MSATPLLNTLSLTDFQAVGLRRPTPSMVDRLQTWLTGKTRARLVAAERALLVQRCQLTPDGEGDVLSLDCLRGTAAAHAARLRFAASGSIDTVVSVGALASAPDVELMLAEIKRVLRPGGRLLFVEPVAARAGTRLRRLQGMMDRLWRVVAGSANAPRDLWNDLKAARFDRLAFEHVNLSGLGGVPVPHLVGEAVQEAGMRATVARPQSRNVGVPRLAWREPAFAFFGR
jgi:SAM-dependent methyltransferase